MHSAATRSRSSRTTPLIVRDVEVTRRLYRSGESEYLIDGEVCRLRDVHDLLMDTGLGAKAYAIIEQGKIGLILSARPTDRRQLIEEAAGRHEVQGAPPRRGAEARSGAAEPDPHRRHRLRGREAARHAEAPGGEGAALPAAARRAAALGEGAVRAAVPRARRGDRVGARAAGRRARARGGRGRARRRGRDRRSSGCASSWPKPTAGTTAAREAAHARELEIGRQQQQIAFDKQQVESLRRPRVGDRRRGRALDARREPARLELDEPPRGRGAARLPSATQAADDAARRRDRAYARAAAEHRRARSRRRSGARARCSRRSMRRRRCGTRSSTPRRRATRIAEQMSDARNRTQRTCEIEAERATAGSRRRGERACAAATRRWTRSVVDARGDANRSWPARAPTRERARPSCARASTSSPALQARLESLEELDAGARRVRRRRPRRARAKANGDVGQMGAVADYLEVDRGVRARRRGVPGRSCCSTSSSSRTSSRRGLQFARDARRRPLSASSCVGAVARLTSTATTPVAGGADAAARRRARQRSGRRRDPRGCVVDRPSLATSSGAAAPRRRRARPIVDARRRVFRGARVVEGGTRAEARGILATRREIKELRERAGDDGAAVERLRDEIAALDVARSRPPSRAIASLQGELHRRKRPVVGFELQVGQRATRRRAHSAGSRTRSRPSAGPPRKSCARRTRGTKRRANRSRASRIEQRTADDLLNAAQRRLFEAREAMQAQAERTAEAKAAHAALVERASALALEVQRLEEAPRELEARLATRRDDLQRTAARRPDWLESIARRRNQARRRAAHVRRAARSRADRRRSVAGAPRGVRGAGRTHPRGAARRSRPFAPKRRSSR